MKLEFTKEEFESFKQILINSGYRKYYDGSDYHDYHLTKALHRTEPDNDDESRADLQLKFIVYDFFVYEQNKSEKPIVLEPIMMVTRNIEERIDMTIMNDSIADIKAYEDLAIKFYDFVCNNIKQ